MEADKQAVKDRNESIGLMEPMRVGEDSRHRVDLTDLAVELAARAAGLKRSLPVGLPTALADLVRSMNCYYSNLIEGHDTHPIEIEKALKKDYSADLKQRNLQREARAHIEVQRWIDQGGLDGRATSVESIKEVHRRFVELLPDDLRQVPHPKTKEMITVEPGGFRPRDVQVGQLLAISPGAVPRFMERFEVAYSDLGKAETILAAAAAHHRLLWVHPFIDGNGRVARLMSHAMLLSTLDSGGIWSIARGFARSVTDYKSHLALCDQVRRNDLDGRGHLSEEALAEFSRYFLETCLDQVSFMESLMQPDRLRIRILQWANEEIRLKTLPTKAEQVLEALLYRGELPRGNVAPLLGQTNRQARRIMSALHEFGVVSAASSRAPWRLAFPAALASRWMPGLFPEKPNT